MTTVLAWATLSVCVILTAIRIPSAVRGENRMVFVLFALISLDILLSIEGPYMLIDGWLGNFNLANLLLRFMLYGTFLLMGIKVARAFGSAIGERAIRGPIGLAVLVATAVLTAVFFFSMDTRGSSVGLSDLDAGPALELYAALGRLYPGYVAVCLIPGIWSSVRGTGPGLLRAASATLLLGLGLMTVSQLFPLIPDSAEWLRPVINYSAALATALGFGGIWLSKAVASRKVAR
ncbi:hypothetical protein GCM10027405_12170 [Arthrobacter alkaliphilus]|jgi:hypothetical protein|uniref:hypothetical protein n=1 Tax=Arthrobacter alkaliphilus TaxID=369936 RepID=UPI001F262FF2|nr:hypothetical protein [Arthrobacter alkaliphilus]